MYQIRLASLLCALLALSACSQNNPAAVSERYWQAVIADDQATVEQLVVETSSPGLSSVIQPGPDSSVEIGRTQRESFDGPEGEEGAAEVPTTIHWVDENGDRSTFETATVLVFEDGSWKVDPAQTRERFFDSVYRSALTGLEAALEESAQAFRELGSEMSETMARELSTASRELQEQSQKANEEIQNFLENLDEELRKELERHQN